MRCVLKAGDRVTIHGITYTFDGWLYGDGTLWGRRVREWGDHYGAGTKTEVVVELGVRERDGEVSDAGVPIGRLDGTTFRPYATVTP